MGLLDFLWFLQAEPRNIHEASCSGRQSLEAGLHFEEESSKYALFFRSYKAPIGKHWPPFWSKCWVARLRPPLEFVAKVVFLTYRTPLLHTVGALVKFCLIYFTLDLLITFASCPPPDKLKVTCRPLFLPVVAVFRDKIISVSAAPSCYIFTSAPWER